VRQEEDFGMHVLRSTQNHNPSAGLAESVFVYCLFNGHVLHHMFPAVDESR
jgi:hypothetical protein